MFYSVELTLQNEKDHANNYVSKTVSWFYHCEAWCIPTDFLVWFTAQL